MTVSIPLTTSPDRKYFRMDATVNTCFVLANNNIIKTPTTNDKTFVVGVGKFGLYYFSR